MLSPTMSNAVDYSRDDEWRGHPDRPCKDDERYSDLTLVRPISFPSRITRKAQIERMRQACFTCPVFRQCRNDVLTVSKDWEFYGLQAGIVGKT